MDAEERRLLAEEGQAADAEHGNYANGAEKHGDRMEASSSAAPAKDMGPAPHKKPNMFTKWLRPDIYTDYATMRRLVPKDIAIHYDRG